MNNSKFISCNSLNVYKYGIGLRSKGQKDCKEKVNEDIVSSTKSDYWIKVWLIFKYSNEMVMMLTVINR